MNLKAIRSLAKSIKNSILTIFYNLICKQYILLTYKQDIRNLKYNFSICLIFKNEALFLQEWLDYHLLIGVDHFYLYNNNSTDDFLIILKPYIEKGLVTLIEWPELNSQFKAYKHCYDTYRDTTKWISFLDADEFICLKIETNIMRWLDKYSKYPAITIQYLMFGTNALLEHNQKMFVIEQYNSCWDHFYNVGKCFINTRYDIADFDVWHLHHHTYMKISIFGIRISVPAVNQFGYICTAGHSFGSSLDKSSIQINHYYLKAYNIYEKKATGTDVLFGENPRKDYSRLYSFDEKCVSRDYTIHRFLLRLKLQKRRYD